MHNATSIHDERTGRDGFASPDPSPSAEQLAWPKWRRCLLIAAAMLILCSCRGLPTTIEPAGAPDVVATDQYDSPAGLVAAAGVPPAGASAPMVVQAAPTEPYLVAVDVSASAATANTTKVDDASPGDVILASDQTSSETALTGGQSTVVQAAYNGPLHHAPAAAQAVAQPGAALSLAPAEYGPPAENWRPPGIRGPWPRDEYLHDGGDHGTPVGVRPDWTVVGLEEEDTVGMYDTLDGRTIVQPSNRVTIYAPRFGVVRRVDDVQGHQQNIGLDVVDRELGVADSEFTAKTTTTLQRLQLQASRLSRNLTEYDSRLQQGNFKTIRALEEADAPLKLHEDFSLIRNGHFDQREAAALNKAVLAAQSWHSDEQVNVILDDVAATAVEGELGVETIYHLAYPESPRLRVVKTASASAVQVGEYVDFTIRYDNVGNQVMGNVVLVDNLTTRLEYVADSAQSSHDAKFSAEPNRADSLTLRWEIQDPLKPGEGGLIRFRCLVR